MSNEIATHDLSREKIELIKQTVAKGATDLELELFLHACKRTGLDPLMKQIYAIPRWNNELKRNTLSFQTGIDGYRLIADRTGKYAGSSDAIFEEVDGRPIMAQVTVMKLVDGEPRAFTASARWDEYVQTTREGKPTGMWQRMPYLMLGKCAEALALRKAFPAELSGVYTHEEMMQADSEQTHKPLLKGAEMLAKMEATKEQLDAPVPMSATLNHEPTTTIFDQSSAYADHETAISDATTVEEAQRAWDDVTKDGRLGVQKTQLYGHYQRKVKALKGK